ncbi:MAG: twin-arginine translocation signal domain-containing protein [Burkholderiales bacterium]|nr:twin-arginine translocation signal domain-containing protein [Burkholderiales bacterium]
MERREFMRACALGVVAAGAALPGVVQGEVEPRMYGRARLTDAGGAPLKSREIPADTNLIFHYPFAATPCFLLNLGRPVRQPARLKTADAKAYEWPGGVGAHSSIVAYSAICSHRLTYPTRDISFISYREERTPTSRHARVIHCCSEHSQYDPAGGAKVLAGPAPQPLAAILLEHDPAGDELWAVGTLGGEMFNDFFAKFEFRLAIEHGAAARRPAEGAIPVVELAQFCRQQVKC